jgi:hypothetical protein
MRTLNRPMFRLGGPANEGITSGLGRQRYEHGGSHPTTEERLRKAAGQQPDTSLSQFLIDFGLDLASRPPTGSIFSTAAASAKEPYQGYKASKAARAGFERQIGLEAAKMDIGQEHAMEIQELVNEGRVNVAEIANDPDRLEINQKIKKLDELFPDGGAEYNRRVKDVIQGTVTGKNADQIVAALIANGRDPDEAVKIAIKIIISLQAGLNVEMDATGGRVGRAGYQTGNAVTGAMPMQASAPQAMAPEGQSSSIQMPYEEFRAAIPAEVSDEIVQLIYYNQDAFADFAQITTQADIYAFNNKYGVSLVLSMDTKTT